MERQRIAAFAPRIYCIDPMLVQSDGWDDLLARIAALEFDHVLLGGAALADHWFADANAAPTTGITGLAQLEQLAHLCTEHGLRLLLDVTLAHWLNDSMLPTTAACGDALPDPRQSSAIGRMAVLHHLHQPRVAEQLLAFWHTRLVMLLDAGAAGFCCREPAMITPSLWQDLIAMTREQRACCHFLAWTPGCTHQQLDGLRDCGFDAVFSSAAWWDFRAPWYFREYDKLSAIASVLACPEYPFGPRLAQLHGWQNAAARRRGALRALQFAAASAPGWVMPMGFEFGLPQVLSIAAGLPGLRTPAQFSQACATAQLDLAPEIRQANLSMLQNSLSGCIKLNVLSAPDAPLLLIERCTESASELLVVNPQLDQSASFAPDHGNWQQRLRQGSWPSFEAVLDSVDSRPLSAVPAAAVQLLALQAPARVVGDTKRPKKLQADKLQASRIAIEHVTPSVEQGRFAAKRTQGEHCTFSADIFMDGHGQLGAAVWLRSADQKQWQHWPMQALGNDRWQATVALPRVGRHYFRIEAWHDPVLTFRDGLKKKAAAGMPLALELREGQQLLRQLLQQAQAQLADAEALSRCEHLLQALADAVSEEAQLALLCADTTVHGMAQVTGAAGTRAFINVSSDYPVDVERRVASYANWYELFPRSQSGRSDVHGTFDDVIARLPAIRAMGFDTVYLPPIHPIGERNRKGKNNSLMATADDPGSPYAIGSSAGGHDAIHPQLGDLQDFQRLIAAAAAQGLALALDFAIQCSPDHPWLQEHPEWFDWRPDGSLRYAENPPKRYEDIVNVDFYADEAIPSLWHALRDVVLHWIAQGVLLFRVDNPHTKPLPFWEWLITTIRDRHPEVIFLAEAFTRPKPMYRLAKLGFSQSYTYFTWRHGKQELIDYLQELTAASDGNGDRPSDYFRPHFFVNTPDINPYFLQRSGRAGFQMRAALAATLSGLWGVYSGFELCEARAVEGKEEYLDSEKYEIRAWDWQRPGNIIDDITRLNQLRAENPALQSHLGVHFLDASNDNILYFVKSTPVARTGTESDTTLRFGDNVVLVAINLDPGQRQEADIVLPLHGFGLADTASILVDDLIDEQRFTWHGGRQRIVLDPRTRPYAIWRLHIHHEER